MSLFLSSIRSAKLLVVIADRRRDSKVLGDQWKQGIPLEVETNTITTTAAVMRFSLQVLPGAYRSVMIKLKKLGGEPSLRMGGAAKVHRLACVTAHSDRFCVLFRRLCCVFIFICVSWL